MATKSAKKPATAIVTRITDDMRVKVVVKKNPFTEGTVQANHANAVLNSNGKTVADAKKKGADSWTVRELVKRKVIAVQSAA